jgi:hypothetical protein
VLYRTAADLHPYAQALAERPSHAESLTRGLLFAREHGLLGTWRHRPALDRIEVAGALHRGEPVREWATWLGQLREVVELAEALRANDPDALRGWLRVRQPRGKPRTVEYGRPDLGHALVLDATLDGVAKAVGTLRGGERDPRAAARLVLRDLARRGLSTYLRVDVEPEGQELLFAVYCDSLLAALWAQLGRSLRPERAEQRRCPRRACGKWIEVSPHRGRGKRPDVTYCSTACRKAAHRERVDAARALHARGVAPATIARQLGTDGATVRRWVGLGRADAVALAVKARRKS